MAEATDTVVTEVDINDILSMPGAESVLLPDDQGDAKPNIFSRDKVDLGFLNNSHKKSPPKKEVPAGESEEEKTARVAREALEAEESLKDERDKDPLNLNLNLEGEGDDPEDKKKTGRPTIMVSATKKLIEKGMIIPFDDGTPIEDYKEEDFLELMEANFSQREQKVQQEFTEQFFDSLPPELQYAAKYAADGGTDFKNLFKALAGSEEVRELDPAKKDHQEHIVRQYLTAKNFGSPEDIEEEITAWKDRDELAAKALKFKPILDKMQEEILTKQIALQERKRQQQQEASKKYVNDIIDILEPGVLNGLKTDRKVQGMLYSGLTQPIYPSISGRPTNLLGHLLEKYQYVEPRHDLIAEALWLLADPEGYRKKLLETGGTEQAKKTVRTLKTEEQRAKNPAGSEREDEDSRRNPKSLKRPTTGPGFFARSTKG